MGGSGQHVGFAADRLLFPLRSCCLMSPTYPRLSPPRAASLPTRASGLVRSAFKLSLQTYLGVAAVAAGSYGAMTYAGPATPDNAGVPPETGPWVDLPTLRQADGDALHLPSGAAPRAPASLRVPADPAAAQGAFVPWPGRRWPGD